MRLPSYHGASAAATSPACRDALYAHPAGGRAEPCSGQLPPPAEAHVGDLGLVLLPAVPVGHVAQVELGAVRRGVPALEVAGEDVRRAAAALCAAARAKKEVKKAPQK